MASSICTSYFGFPSHFHELTKSKKSGSEIVSSLELQMILYFNTIFFPFWFITVVFMLYEKLNDFHNLYRVITTIVLCILIPIEGFRLYLGFIGNLLEKIPELAGFWMLSLLLQFPLQIFALISKGTLTLTAEKSVQFVMCIMLLSELIFGFLALKHIAQHRANNFHLTRIRSSDSNLMTINLQSKNKLTT